MKRLKDYLGNVGVWCVLIIPGVLLSFWPEDGISIPWPIPWPFVLEGICGITILYLTLYLIVGLITKSQTLK